jgi:hypothetical protein
MSAASPGIEGRMGKEIPGLICKCVQEFIQKAAVRSKVTSILNLK